MTTFFLTAALVLWKAHLSESAWNTDYAHAIKYVRSQDKPLFILFDITTSESGQAAVQSAMFLNEKVERALTDDYIRLFVDIETETGRTLAADFGVTEYPRVVVIDRSGDWQVYRRSGFHSADDLQSILTRYRRSKLISAPSTVDVSTHPISSGPTTMAPLCKT